MRKGRRMRVIAAIDADRKQIALPTALGDRITKELVAALSGVKAMEFDVLFAKAYEVLKRREGGCGREEVLRRLCYEKLLRLVARGLVEMRDETFRGLAGIERVLSGQGSSTATKPRGDVGGKAADLG
jgi:hypothetical protein